MRRLFASITARVRGTRTPATATSAGCSFCSPRGGLWAGRTGLTSQRQENSSTARGLFMHATVVRGSSGEPGGSAVAEAGA